MPQKLKQGLLAEHFSHPLDKLGMQRILERLLKSEALKSQLEKLQTEVEEEFYLWNLADNTKLSYTQGGSVYKLVQEVSVVLGIKTPYVFLDTSAEINAYVLGGENPSIVLTSALLDASSEDILRAVIGHELGHIICQHTFYRLLAENYNWVSSVVGLIPLLGPFLSLGLQISLFDWYRKSELSADRVALLATQNLESVQKCFLLLAGGASRISSELNLSEFSKQAEEFQIKLKAQREGDISKQVGFLLSGFMLQHAMSTHPWPAVRLQEINKWKFSKQYELLIAGEYERAVEEAPILSDELQIALATPVGEDFKGYTKGVAKNIGKSLKGFIKRFEQETYNNSLIAASGEGNLETVKLLIEKGADVNVKDKKGNTPLKNALSHGKTDIAEFLREAGAKE